MTRLFDRRHRWGPEVPHRAGFTRTCEVCGRTDYFESFIPKVFMEAVGEWLSRPNPYRALFRS